jgi:hypothetical protein
VEVFSPLYQRPAGSFELKPSNLLGRAPGRYSMIFALRSGIDGEIGLWRID